MLKRKTVFILGAGAGKEINMPTGIELMRTIGRFLDRDSARGPLEPIFEQALSVYCRSDQSSLMKHVEAARLISKNMMQATSIDNFIHTHSEKDAVVRLGKLAICASIADAEHQSALLLTDPVTLQRRFLPETLIGSWFPRLLRVLIDAVKVDEADNIIRNVSFISFNYDRCLEEYLFQAVKQYLGLDDTAAYAITSRFKIVHPFGQISPLPRSGMGVDYGQNPIYANVPAMINNIRTFTEGVEDKSLLYEIRSLINEAERIVFMGFAYHPLNMELLRTNGNYVGKDIIGTAFGESATNTEVFKQRVRGLFKFDIGTDNISVRLQNEKCVSFFDDNLQNFIT